VNKHQLQANIKSTGTAYLLAFFLCGSHYAYLERWGVQFLYWITLGGLGFWALADLFLIPGYVSKHNAWIYQKLGEIEEREKREHQAAQLAMIAAARR
jgi:hypothetical protein